MSRKHLRRASCLSLLATAVGLLSGTAFAQTATPPDAGQTLRDNRQPVAPQRPSSLPSLSVPDETDPGSNPSQRLTVSAIRIEGNANVPTTVLMALVADVQGKDQSLGELRAAVRRITDYYRAHGYVVARAYIPAQTIDNGVVVVRVLEGRLAGAAIDNHSAVLTTYLQAVLNAQKLNGDVIVSRTTDRALLLMADLPGVGKVSGKLKPGAEVGTSDLIVTAGAGKRFEGNISVDTYGNRYTGQNRLSGQAAFNNPLHLGDRLSVQTTLTDENMLYGRAAYDLPFGGNGLRIGAAISNSSYELGREFASLDATGTARTTGLYALYPLVRGLNHNIWLSTNIESRDLKDEIASVNVVTHKSASVATLAAYGDMTDVFFGGGYTNWSLSYVSGNLKINSAAARATDALGPMTAGHYSKLAFSASRLQALTAKTSLSLSLNTQAAGKNLDSSEKFVVGGIYGVRAYPQGEGAGDTGWLANIELRHQVRSGLQVAAFYDAGRVQFSRNLYAPGRNAQSLDSYGISAAAQRGHVNARITMAFHDGDKATTAPDRRPRLWASLGYSF
ncbi:ShlB/FhaC/HecB family hemolysin secretion/activation protein [Asticcacaulis sp. 201]|uniref:ShlB/FhaC/HecB family hemolysin secretion/activation protein n=1 Tax=Asticcacaulis sp. 201 TaxID=3028787 RepID=UPI00291713BF|nr:ShlB/FhaC/HecB family hemolysin secretion/activation protein [Asticcacaulis sp. 201]MDV6331333.1 ShlB/FhaC/HecB family hemolysin secretion/activation protein [Asticcacaulis sp. 201]